MSYSQTESAPTLWVFRGVLGQNYTRLSVAESVRCDKVLARFAYLSQAVYVNQIVIPAPLCGRRWGAWHRHVIYLVSMPLVVSTPT